MSCILRFYFFLPFFFLYFFVFAYKRVAIIDEKNKILIIRDKTMIPCCCNCKYQRIYYFNTIKKVVIYITSQPDPNVGFKNLLFINSELISIDWKRENLFAREKYNEQKINEYLTFFKRYFDTEFKPENTEMDNNLTPEENQPIVTNSNEDNNITSKPSMNEEAATPIIS